MSATGPRPSRSPAKVVAIGGAANVVCLLPVFLTGTMATFIESDLRLDAVTLGLAVALFRAAGAAVSPFMGRRTDRIGATKSLRFATGAAAVCSAGIAVSAHTTMTLVLWLMAAGCSVALAQPAANRLLASGVTAGRLGRAFGIKQSAPPVASAIAGISVPVVAVTVGWRWAFVAASIFAALLTLAVRPVPRTASRASNPPRSFRSDRTTILTLAVAFGLGTSVSSAITTFFVIAVVQRGTDDVAAGTLLALAGGLAVATRVLAGIRADHRRGNHLRFCAVLAALGCLGVAGLAVADSVAFQGLAVIVALVGTWGFNGVFWFALIRAFPASPGAITGAVAPGALLGSTIGPLLFGLIAEASGYTLAFAFFSALAAATALALLMGNTRLARGPTGSETAGALG